MRLTKAPGSTRSRRRGGGLPIVCLLASASLAAQTTPLPPPGPGAFEVASIKPSPPPTGQGLFVDAGSVPGGQWAARNSTLLMVMRSAYPGFPLDAQVAGGPAWVGSDRFDIAAKAEGEPSPDAMRGLLRQLLADRFKLKVHAAAREMDVYVLVTARQDGRLGPGLKPSTIDCEARYAARQRGELPSTPPARPEPGKRPECGMMTMLGNGVQRVSAGGVKLSSVVAILQSAIGRPVFDRTGLTQLLDVDLEFAREGVPQAASAEPSAAPNVFTAVQEQLGIKMDRMNAPVEVIVIDKVEKPLEM